MSAARRPAKAFGLNPRIEVQVRLAKWYAGQTGEGGQGSGGWIYAANGKPVAQGWWKYYDARRRRIWEALDAGGGNSPQLS